MGEMFCGLTVKQIGLLKKFFEQATGGKAPHTICEADLVFASKPVADPAFDLMPLYGIGEANPIGYVKVPRE